MKTTNENILKKIMAYDIPYVPSTPEKVETMVELSQIKPGEKSADLGSGDGRVVIAMAQKGAIAHGFEIDPYRAVLGEDNIYDAGLVDKAFIHHKSFWDINLSEFDVISLYGITGIMDRLEKKLQQELKSNARVVSNIFTFPNWEPVQKKEDVYLFIKDHKVSLD